MSTPVILYNSAGIPIGPRIIVQIYRPPTTTDTNGFSVASVVPFGSETNGTPVGDPIAIDNASMDFNGESVTTKGIYGQDNNDPSLLRGKPTLNLDAFISSAGRPTVFPGDYISLYVGMQITSTATVPVSVPASRWMFNANSIATAGANKFALKLELDRPNSSPNLKEF
jgi:hypothetical protein